VEELTQVGLGVDVNNSWQEEGQCLSRTSLGQALQTRNAILSRDGRDPPAPPPPAVEDMRFFKRSVTMQGQGSGKTAKSGGELQKQGARHTIKSLPWRTIGQVWLWIAVGEGKPAFFNSAKTYSAQEQVSSSWS